MKFSCEKKDIIDEIGNALDFTAQKNTLSILSNILLILEDDTLTIKATDQQVGYIASVNVMGLENGKITVVCDKFQNILKNLPEGKISVEEKDEKIIITADSGKISFQLKTVSSSDFPEITEPLNENFFSVPQKDFMDMINNVIFAVSDDSSKYAMNGSFFEKEGNALVMVGTDGRRLSYIKRQIDNEIPDFNAATIPTKFISIIKKMGTEEGSFDISIQNTTIFIKFTNYTVFSTLINKDFPAYKRVIPNSTEYYFVVDIKHLTEAIKRVSLLIENKFRKIYFSLSENKLIIHSDENDIGSGKEEIECEYYGEDVKFAFNYTYLINPLKVMEGEKVRISFNSPERPIKVTSEPERDYLHIIMPMNIN